MVKLTKRRLKQAHEEGLGELRGKDGEDEAKEDDENEDDEETARSFGGGGGGGADGEAEAASAALYAALRSFASTSTVHELVRTAHPASRYRMVKTVPRARNVRRW